VHPGIVRHIVSPLLERLLGRRTFRFLRELETSQWWSAQRIRSLQETKLRTLFELASSNCDWYRSLFAQLDINIHRDDPFAILRILPRLDKQTIREQQAALTNASVEGGPIPFNTGGSTGEPLSFVVDRRRIAFDKAARLLTHSWFGVQPGDREVYLWGSPLELRRQDRVKRFRDRLTNELLLDAFHLNPQSMSRYLDRITAFDPVSIFGYPSSLTTFAEYCLATNKRYGAKKLRAVFVTGEVVNAAQRATLSQFFNVPIVDGYGSRDGGFIAHECPHGSTHVMDQNVIVEILDDDGQPVVEGTSGEIVLTHLDAHALPLIRYRTGDMATRRSDRCGCGRGLSLIGPVEGRRGDHLVAADGTLAHPLAAIYVMREMRAIKQFRIKQERDRSINVQIVASDEPGATDGYVDHKRIITDLRRRLGPIPVSVSKVATIPVAKSGKHLHVISDAVLGIQKNRIDDGYAEDVR